MRHAAALAALAATLPATEAAYGADPATTSLRQRAAVEWTNRDYAGRERESFTIPGIGTGEIVCRPDAVFVRMRPNDPSLETTMWSSLFHRKPNGTYPAVHNARVYTFSTPTSLIPHGTGGMAHEGLNLRRPVENAGRGTAIGIISQRSARNAPVVGDVAPTSFTLRWRWSSFRSDPAQAECRVSITLTTQLAAGVAVRTRTVGRLERSPGPAANSLNLGWHGEPDASGKTMSKEVEVPYLGALSVSCEPGRETRPGLVLRPDDPASEMFASVVMYQGEGLDAAIASRFVVDRTTGLLGPIPLPVNGMLELTLSDGTRTARVIVSSLRKTNDPDGAGNFCEVAAQVVSDSA